MMYIRGNKEDYDGWEDMGNPGWNFEDVLPYFLKSEDNLQINEVDGKYHRTGGLLSVSKFPYNPPLSYAILRAGQELGMIFSSFFTFLQILLKNSNFFTLRPGFDIQDLNAANSTGFMIAQMTSKNGVRVSSSRAFLRPAQARQNLHIMLNTTVAKVLINPRSKNAFGVEVIDAFGHTMKVSAKKEVIVAGGAVNSPQILMLSGIGPKEELTRVSLSFFTSSTKKLKIYIETNRK